MFLFLAFQIPKKQNKFCSRLSITLNSVWQKVADYWLILFTQKSFYDYLSYTLCHPVATKISVDLKGKVFISLDIQFVQSNLVIVLLKPPLFIIYLLLAYFVHIFLWYERHF